MRFALALIVATATAHAATPSSVHAALDGDLVRLTARYPIAKLDKGSEITFVELPPGALVIGATVDAHRLALVESPAATESMRAAEDAPSTRDQRWATLIASGGGDQVAVTILSPGPGFAQLELEIAAPSCYFHDARWVAVPDSWPHGTKAPECGAGTAWIAVEDRTLAKNPGGLDRIGGDAGRLALDDEHVARVELDIASKLGEVPRDLMTAIVIDSSRSIDDERVLAQRKLVMEYAKRVPETRLQIISFARTPHAVLAGWTTASQILPRLERLLAAEPLRNGSNLDDALVMAQAWLSELPGTHRILVLTDENYSEKLNVLALRGAIAPDTLVHVAVLEGSGRLVREDGTLNMLASGTYGMRVSGGPDDPELLVRPMSMDQVRVRAPGWTALREDCSPDLAEGHGCTWWFTGEPSAAPITIEGLVWGRRVARTFAPSLDRGTALARELSTSNALDPAHQALVERAARAVNSVWSLFGAWGGRGGYDGMSSGWGTTGGSGSCDCIGHATLGHGSGTGNPRVDQSLAAQLAPAISACHAERDQIDVTLELTRAEIVDVGVELLSVGDPSSLRRRHDCLVEAIWDVDLVLSGPEAHTTAKVQVGVR